MNVAKFKAGLHKETSDLSSDRAKDLTAVWAHEGVLHLCHDSNNLAYSECIRNQAMFLGLKGPVGKQKRGTGGKG